MTGRSVVAGALARWLLRVSGNAGVSIWIRSAARVGLRTARFTSVGSPMTASATYSR
jgi:cytidylate kinase